MKCFRTSFILVVTALVSPVTANAVLTTYTDQASFLVNLPGAETTLDFDSTAAGTLIGNGDTIGGITFNHSFFDDFGIDMQVTDVFDATSGENSLGVETDAEFLDGDDFSLGLPSVNAIGMYFIATDPVFADEITITIDYVDDLIPDFSFGTSGVQDGVDLDDGGIPYFIGIIDTMNAFDLALITTSGNPQPIDPVDGYFGFNIDDITTSMVPIPAAGWLFLSGLIGLFTLRKKTA